MVSISVIIPTIRNVSLNEKALSRQSFSDYETIIVRPNGPKPEGLFYTLNRDYNRGIKQAKGQLVVSYQDMIDIRPDTLERFWEHYKSNPKAIVGALGDQYSSMEPPVKVWSDPRKTTKYGSYYPCMPDDIEFTLCAIPRQAFIDVGGFDEEYDKGAAVGEKELMRRMFKAGYEPYLDQSIEYRALHHPRMTKDWDHYYQIASKMYFKHIEEIESGKRLRLDFIK